MATTDPSAESGLPRVLWFTDDPLDWLDGWARSFEPLHGTALNVLLVQASAQPVESGAIPSDTIPAAAGLTGAASGLALASVLERFQPHIVHIDCRQGRTRARFACQLARVAVLSQGSVPGEIHSPPASSGLSARLKQAVAGRTRAPDVVVHEFQAPAPLHRELDHPFESGCGTSLDDPDPRLTLAYPRAATDAAVLLVDARGLDAVATTAAIAHVQRVQHASPHARILVIPNTAERTPWDQIRGLVVLPWLIDRDAAILSADAVLHVADSRPALRTLMRASVLGRPAVGVSSAVVKLLVREGDTGFLCDGRGQSLPDLVRRALGDASTLGVVGARAARHARRAFDQDVVVARLLGIWDRALSGTTGSPLDMDSSGNLFAAPLQRGRREHVKRRS